MGRGQRHVGAAAVTAQMEKSGSRRAAACSSVLTTFTRQVHVMKAAVRQRAQTVAGRVVRDITR
jgi:hypothetical protein